MSKVSSAIAATTIVALVVAGCGSPKGGSATADTLSIGMIAEPASLDFSTNEGAAIPQAMLLNVYEPLVRVGQDGRVTGHLAQRWDVSGDLKTYTFTLHKDVKFSSGAPFTADDVVFSIDRVKTAWKLKIARKMDVVDTVEKRDDHTVVVRLKQPSNNWLFDMTTRVGAMFSRTGVAELATKPVGTGPYTFDSWRRGDSIKLVANTGYWGTAPKSKTVLLKYFKDSTALNNALLTGGIDVVSTVQAPESLPQFTRDSRFDLIEGTTSGEVVLSFNNSKAPLNDVRVRRAIRYAIDHKALLQAAWAGRGQLIGSMVPPTDPWYEDLTAQYPHDPQKARQLLAEAGTPNPVLRLRIPGLPYAVAAGQVVKSQLAQVGITAELDQLEFPARWLDEVYTKADYDMSIIAHAEPRDLATFADHSYYFKYRNPAFDALLAQADAGSPDEQVARTKQAARLLSEDAAADWLFLLPNLMVAVKGVTGLPTNIVSEGFDLGAVAKKP